MREVTWEGVTREFKRAEVVVFQKWMVLSEDPPPVARREGVQGHHASACGKRGTDSKTAHRI